MFWIDFVRSSSQSRRVSYGVVNLLIFFLYIYRENETKNVRKEKKKNHCVSYYQCATVTNGNVSVNALRTTIPETQKKNQIVDVIIERSSDFNAGQNFSIHVFSIPNSNFRFRSSLRWFFIAVCSFFLSFSKSHFNRGDWRSKARILSYFSQTISHINRALLLSRCKLSVLCVFVGFLLYSVAHKYKRNGHWITLDLSQPKPWL